MPEYIEREALRHLMKFKNKTLTNADRIRSMSDVEIAKLFVDAVADGCPPEMNWDCCKDEYGWDGCEECWKNWLRSPACARGSEV